jgi:DNA-binding transcriptional ArsR family regulator
MLRLVLNKPDLTVSTIAEELSLSVSLASFYLRALEARGLLTVRRKGRHVHYRLASPAAGEASEALVAALRVALQREPQAGERIFKLATAFTHPRRLDIFHALSQEPSTFGQLRAATGVSAWALQRHLLKLQSRGFIAQRDQKYFVASLTDGVARALAKLAIEP